MLQVWNRISLNRKISVKKFCELKLIISFVKGSKRKSHALLKYNNLCVHIKKSLLTKNYGSRASCTYFNVHAPLFNVLNCSGLTTLMFGTKKKSRNASDWKTQLREKNQILKNRVDMISVCIPSIQ